MISDSDTFLLMYCDITCIKLKETPWACKWDGLCVHWKIQCWKQN